KKPGAFVSDSCPRSGAGARRGGVGAAPPPISRRWRSSSGFRVTVTSPMLFDVSSEKRRPRSGTNRNKQDSGSRVLWALVVSAASVNSFRGRQTHEHEQMSGL